jgi:uncharacterized Ntn-hydrolase superfamily protein
MWGEEALRLMRAGRTAREAVEAVTAADAGRDQRQLAALAPGGGTGAFTGAESIAVAGSRSTDRVVVAGNLLSDEAVLDACLDGFLDAEGSFDARLLAALEAAARAGGDSRGLLSAALLVVRRDAAPLTLRIDYSKTPLEALADLHRRATTGPYADWARHVPVLDAPHRGTPWRQD